MINKSKLLLLLSVAIVSESFSMGWYQTAKDAVSTKMSDAWDAVKKSQTVNSVVNSQYVAPVTEWTKDHTIFLGITGLTLGGAAVYNKLKSGKMTDLKSVETTLDQQIIAKDEVTTTMPGLNLSYDKELTYEDMLKLFEDSLKEEQKETISYYLKLFKRYNPSTFKEDINGFVKLTEEQETLFDELCKKF